MLSFSIIGAKCSKFSLWSCTIEADSELWGSNFFVCHMSSMPRSSVRIGPNASCVTPRFKLNKIVQYCIVMENFPKPDCLDAKWLLPIFAGDVYDTCSMGFSPHERSGGPSHTQIRCTNALYRYLCTTCLVNTSTTIRLVRHIWVLHDEYWHHIHEIVWGYRWISSTTAPSHTDVWTLHAGHDGRAVICRLDPNLRKWLVYPSSIPPLLPSRNDTVNASLSQLDMLLAGSHGKITGTHSWELSLSSTRRCMSSHNGVLEYEPDILEGSKLFYLPPLCTISVLVP